MSKFACHCGGIISDTHYPSATEGWLFREQDEESHFDVICRDIASFIAADRISQREVWIRNFFPEPYPTDLDDENMINDIIAFHARRVRLSVCECSKCGRLYVERQNNINSYAGYAPIDDKYNAILKSHSEPSCDGG
jgi:hypothetical protein